MMLGQTGRYALRICVVAAIAGLGLLKTVIDDGLTASEVIDVLGTTIAAAAAYAGIGAVSRNVEPNVAREAPPGTPGTQ